MAVIPAVLFIHLWGYMVVNLCTGLRVINLNLNGILWIWPGVWNYNVLHFLTLYALHYMWIEIGQLCIILITLRVSK